MTTLQTGGKTRSALQDVVTRHSSAQARARPLIQEACPLGSEICRRICLEDHGHL